MANNDDLVQKIGNLIDQKLEPINNRLDGLEKGQVQTHAAIAQNTTILEAVKAGQDDIRKELVKKADKADIQNLDAKLVRKITDHEARIEELEKDAGIPHPHKH